MGADAGVNHTGGGQVHPAATAKGRRWPKQALLACFFLLGMGLITFTNATKQAADYFNARYKGMYTNRVVDTCYTAGFMLTLFALFFGGPDMWPNKRARMYYGYVVFLAALVLPTLIDAMVGQMSTDAGGGSPRAGLAPWAVGAFAGGAADVTVASVLNGEAAALGCNKAAAYGRSIGGVFIVSLRLTIKALFPAGSGDLTRLQLSVCIHLALAAVILLACVLVTTFAIPYLVDLVQQTESAEVPPGLSFPQTLTTAYTVLQGGPQGEAAAAALQAACSLAPMQPTVESTFGLPLMEVRRLGGFTLRLSMVQDNPADTHASTALHASTASTQQPTAHSTFDASLAGSMRQQSVVHRYIDQHASSFAHRRQHRASNCSTPSALTDSRCTTPAKSPLSTAPAGFDAGQLAHGPSIRRQLSSVLGRRPTRRSSGAGGRTPRSSQRATPPPLSPHSVTEDHDARVLVAPGGQHTAQQQDVSRGADAPRTSDQTGMTHDAVDLEQQLRVQRLTCTSILHQADGLPDDRDAFSTGSMSPSPFVKEQLSRRESHYGDAEQGAVKIPLRDVLGACCKVLREERLPVFQLALLVIPIISEQNKAMVWGSTAEGTAIEIYYAQLVELAKLTGSMLGSQFVPVFHPGDPKFFKPLLLGLSATMATFLAAFAVARHFCGGAVVMIVLVFCCYAFGGHVNSTTYTLAKDMPTDDRRMAQMILSMTSAIGSWLAYCLSWIWVAIPTV